MFLFVVYKANVHYIKDTIVVVGGGLGTQVLLGPPWIWINNLLSETKL